MSEPQQTIPAAPPHSRHISFWLKELPFSLVLIVTMIGVAYTSFSREPLITYWEILAPVIGLVCIASGWHEAYGKSGHWRLIGTQVLHWFAFLLVMNMLLLPSVQVPFSASATGLAVFTLLALGTFTAGVNVLSWHICLLGLIMALCIPAIAWIQNSALIVVLIAVTVIVIAAVLWWYWHKLRTPSALQP